MLRPFHRSERVVDQLVLFDFNGHDSFESDQTLVVTSSQDVDQFNFKPTKTFNDLRGWCCSEVVASS